MFALQNKTEADTEFGKLTVNHKPAINVEIFGSSLGEGEYLLKSHQTNFDSSFGKSSWKVEAGHRATYILTNTGYLLSSGDNSWSQQVGEYSYDDVNGEFVFAQNIDGDENYPNQGNNSDRHFKNVIDVSAGAYHLCMLHGKRNEKGRLWCKGKSNRGQALYDGRNSTANQYKEAIKKTNLARPQSGIALFYIELLRIGPLCVTLLCIPLLCFALRCIELLWI